MAFRRVLGQFVYWRFSCFSCVNEARGKNRTAQLKTSFFFLRTKNNKKRKTPHRFLTLCFPFILYIPFSAKLFTAASSVVRYIYGRVDLIG
jgi:hypothetical protein